MTNDRRTFLKIAGIAGIGVAGAGVLDGLNAKVLEPGSEASSNAESADETKHSIIGLYGPWAYSLIENEIPAFSFRNEKWQNVKKWRKSARQRLLEKLAIPDIGGVPKVTVKKQYTYDGLHVEELSWQLPYGRPTAAILLKPENVSGRLPAILAFHDHGGNKYFGTHKITRTSDKRHPLIESHQDEYYSGLAWANEIAKRGYVVLVADAFLFASRRVMLGDVPLQLRKGLNDDNPEDTNNIKAYNTWAADHEHVMAKSLFSAGTTWPGVCLAEDQKALDVLCARPDVDENRIGCGGLSGGGIRTVFMGGVDPRIKCAVCMGFMTSWKDLILNKSYTHTWMTYVPGTPKDLDFPEILGLRVPLPTLVLNNINDGLFTLSEMKASDKILGDVYKKADAEDNYKCSFHPGPHKFDKSMQTEAFDWFDKWLKA
ncbi:alpha/beta hydrolase family protein [Daejeonella sp.]|uniref:alpha/beta hydrolase family protein n=1 Tax=Daejeonella sp. TaxID=2805397 RepID=UPI0030BDA7C5